MMFLVAYSYRKSPLPTAARWSTGPFLSLVSMMVGLFVLGYIGASTVGVYVGTLLSMRSEESYLRPVRGETLGVSDSVGWIGSVWVKRTESGFPAFTTTVVPLPAPVSTFRLDIPALSIENAEVQVNSQTFEDALGHFPGSALPGAPGNVFISGHSVLPQFFNPRDYKTIFSTLPEIEMGNAVRVTMAGMRYTYRVIKKSIVDPSDVSVLLPLEPYGRYLTLMTCVPPGLQTKRLVVVAELVTEGTDGIPRD